ncbi:glycoside hydrolase family 43 protein [Deinococcus radiopugnans]|uniref:glycoside hydrolase family 43 protein n=1 Tax=Deinococcus radiopugnans TaxID=57497 RepID=UPI00361CAA3C
MSRFPVLLGLGLTATLLSSASQAGGGHVPVTSNPARPAAARPTTATPTPASAATFRNPVLDENFPDPGILRVGKVYHAYSTNGGGANVPHAVSRDLVHWEVTGDAMPVLPPWAIGGRTWAPEVTQIGGGFALYFTALDEASGRQCIGVATAASPAGPFRDASRKPLVCQIGEGGSIDASPFKDADGKRYLLWKNDGNCCSQPTNLYLQPLSADGLKLTGKASALIQNFQLWEGNVIEAPTLYRAGGVYYLLYSAGPYDSDLYAVGYATAPRVTGPYKKAPENPILVSKGRWPGRATRPWSPTARARLGWPTTPGPPPDVRRRGWLPQPAPGSGDVRRGRVKVAGPTLTPQRAPTP